MSTLETPRLRLRQWQPGDWPAFARMSADPQVMAHFPACLDASASQDLAERCQADLAQRGWGLWALEHKASGEFAGFTGLNVPRADLPCSPCVEISWRLALPFWGQGLATEAAQAALAYGFAHLQLSEIVAFTSLGNHRSQALMVRLGMHRAAATFAHPALPTDHPLSEHCLYRLPRAVWQSRSDYELSPAKDLS